MVEQFRTELRWIAKVSSELELRAPAKHASIVPGSP
jgi:hypothetical protein